MSFALQDYLSTEEVETWAERTVSRIPTMIPGQQDPDKEYTPVVPYDGIEHGSRYVEVIRDYLKRQDNPGLSAEQLGDLVVTACDIMMAYYGMQLILFEAVFGLNNTQASLMLAVLTAALASLPDAINASDATMRLRGSPGGGAVVEINPGDVITVDDRGRLWADLPNWNMEMTEIWSGGIQSLAWNAPITEGRDCWTNANTYCAYLIDRHSQLKVFRRLQYFVLTAMVAALETHQKQPTPFSQPERPELYIPAACRMIQILGHKIYQWSNEEPQFDIYMESEMIKEPSEFTMKRWSLWKKNFGKFASTNDIEIVIHAALTGAELMHKIETSA